MIIRRLRSSGWLSFLILSSVVLAFLASGCMWGVVTDARTGAPVADALVSVQDSNGNARFTTTDANGIFYFDQSAPSPARGDALLFVSSENGGAQIEKRTIDYMENPGATFENPMSFWEVQALQVPGQVGLDHDLMQRFTIVFPNDWLIMPALEPNKSELSSAMMAIGMNKGLSMSICVVESDPLPPGGMPEHWWREVPDDVKITERVNDQIAGEPATRLVMTFKLQGNEYLDEVETDTWVFDRGQQVWFIQCMTDPNNFGGQALAYENIAKSFKFDP